MWAFLMIHLFDKMPDTRFSLDYIIMVIEVNLFLLESEEGFQLGWGSGDLTRGHLKIREIRVIRIIRDSDKKALE